MFLLISQFHQNVTHVVFASENIGNNENLKSFRTLSPCIKDPCALKTSYFEPLRSENLNTVPPRGPNPTN